MLAHNFEGKIMIFQSNQHQIHYSIILIFFYIIDSIIYLFLAVLGLTVWVLEVGATL